MSAINIKIKGFTLAEVLITLVIIGVIAALTIPTLINKNQKTETLTKLKKCYSELSQAIKLSEVTNGSIKNWDYSDNWFDIYVIPYLKTIKTCDSAKEEWEEGWVEGGGDSSCLPNTYISTNKTNPDTGLADALKANKSYITASGYMLMNPGSGSGYQNISVDINGPAKPNKIGRDLFNFVLVTNNTIIDPAEKANWFNYSNEGLFILGSGASRTLLTSSDDTACSEEGYGGACAGLIMYDNWQILDDYPW